MYRRYALCNFCLIFVLHQKYQTHPTGCAPGTLKGITQSLLHPKAMRKLLLIPGIFLLLMSVACGSGSGSSNGGGGFGNGGSNGFSNASLSGAYTYQATGFDFASNANLPFREAGVFVADGKGNITGGSDDLTEGTSLFSDTITGTYNIASDGTGTATMSFSNGGVIRWAFTMVTTSKVLFTTPVVDSGSVALGVDINKQSSGVALKQDSTVMSTFPSGTFAFGLHRVSSTQGSSSTAGAFSIGSGGVVSSGNEDVLLAGALTPHTLTGLFNSTDTFGRGTGTLTNELSQPITFVYYMVNANTMFILSTDSGVNGVGRAEKQSTSTFALSSLSGGYAFGSQGDTSSLDAVNSAGRFSAGGDGTITAGVFDTVQDGTPATNVAFTGTYTVTTKGRVVLDLTPGSGSPIEQIAWMVSPTRAFFLVNDGAKTEDGTMDGQTGTFSNTSLNGAFTFATNGFNQTDSFARVGTMTGDGAGNLKLAYALTEPNLATQAVSLNGTYTVNSNGRATASVDTLSANLVFYLISGSDGYIVQADTGTEIAGSFTKQQ